MSRHSTLPARQRYRFCCLRQIHRQDEEGSFDFELRSRRDCEHERHGGRAEVRAGWRLRHGRFGSGAAARRSSAAQAAERRCHAARRVTHLRKRGASGHLRREKSHPRDERRKTHRAGEPRSAGEESGLKL